MSAELNAISTFLHTLWSPREVREIRVPKHDGRNTTAGYFDDPAKAAEAVAAIRGQANIYVTLNPVNPALLARAANRMKPRMATTTNDRDVVRRDWLLVDLDSVRPADISATDDEVMLADEVGRRITKDLLALGWPMPIYGASGNGRHLLYRVDLPNNDDDARTLVTGVLLALDERYTTDTVKVDTSVYNAARITAVLGTVKRKGDDIPDRPHRRSEVIHVPDPVVPVPLDLLRAMAGSTTKSEFTFTATDDGVGHGWVKRWLDAAGIAYREKVRSSETWFRLDECPVHPGEDMGETAASVRRPTAREWASACTTVALAGTGTGSAMRWGWAAPRSIRPRRRDRPTLARSRTPASGSTPRRSSGHSASRRRSGPCTASPDVACSPRSTARSRPPARPR